MCRRFVHQRDETKKKRTLEREFDVVFFLRSRRWWVINWFAEIEGGMLGKVMRGFGDRYRLNSEILKNKYEVLGSGKYGFAPIYLS